MFQTQTDDTEKPRFGVENKSRTHRKRRGKEEVQVVIGFAETTIDVRQTSPAANYLIPCQVELGSATRRR